ncbi:MAG: pyridoxine 5'-phosphate synthase [Candidatus Marinimicrobia bacterium]|nr:pyridoxine 5'-phosphate synthase [Candidatus Neomarinimicrobiota bacterium]
MALLEVRLDAVAEIRDLIGDSVDPVKSAVVAELAGADGIGIKLSDDREEERMRDLSLLQEVVNSRLNLIINSSKRQVDKALSVSSAMVTLYDELGLTDSKAAASMREAISVLKNNKNLAISIRINPEVSEAKTASRLGADYVDIDTSRFAVTKDYHDRTMELERIAVVARAAFKFDLMVSAGGNLSYQNAAYIAEIEQVDTVSMGKSIISRGMLIGLENAVRDAIDLVN